MKNKYALYPLIVSICALFCFIAVLVFYSGTVQPLWGRMIPLILPALLLGIVAFGAIKGKLDVSGTIMWTTVLSSLLFLASVVYLFILLMGTATTTTTDTKYYKRAYAQIDGVDKVKEVFPKSIPADANDITFTYFPQFLQGGEVFELSYTTTDEKLAEWKTFLEEEAEWIGSNQEWHIENDWDFSGMDTMRYQLAWDGGFNHGEICYVLMDEEMRRITFYYSKW